MRSIFPSAGLVAGLISSGAIIVGSMTASEARRRADPGSAQAEAVYVHLGFGVIPEAGAVGRKLGDRLGRGGPSWGSHG